MYEYLIVLRLIARIALMALMTLTVPTESQVTPSKNLTVTSDLVGRKKFSKITLEGKGLVIVRFYWTVGRRILITFSLPDFSFAPDHSAFRLPPEIQCPDSGVRLSELIVNAY